MEKYTLNEGWKLGWLPDPLRNKWIVGFNTWRVTEGSLVGTPTSYTRALIYANCAPEGDQEAAFRFTLEGDSTELRPILCYSITRLAGYYLVLRPGQPISGYYVYSELYEHPTLEACGPNLEADREYTLRAERRGDTLTLLLDGEEVGSFEVTEPAGAYTAFSVTAGQVRIGEMTITAGGEVRFQDDFSENSLPDRRVAPFPEPECPEWIDAVVPGTVQTALLQAGRIPDPYLPFQGEKVHWVNDQRWVYQNRFTVPPEFRGKRLRLLFQGVDYLAHFWLNGQFLGDHEGMFGGPELDVTGLVDYEGENRLTVCILPCPNPPHDNVRPYIFHRWHFNMDVIPAGLWQEVALFADDRICLSEPQVVTREIRADGTALVDLGVTLSTMALWPFDARVRFLLHSPDPADPVVSTEVAPGFCQGSLRVKATLEVPQAKLWWPAGMGRQNLYQVDILADLYEYQKQPEPTAQDALHLRTGLRTLAAAPMPGAGTQTVPNNPLGLYNWCFTVNGRPFFAKGSNWMPVDQLLRLDRERYRRLLTRVVDSNILFLRPWGAGLLETEDFYDLCDELGICVWQETLFANGIYSGSRPEVWQETMERSILRLRNHPSLAIWCGGNEFDPDLPDNRDRIALVTALIQELDPSREFRPACPYGGDNHSYLVNWMGGQPYSAYTNDLSIAITEFSLASPPCMDTLRRLISEEALAAFPPDLPDNLSRYDLSGWGRELHRRESEFSVLDAHLSGITGIMLPPMSDCGIPHSMEEFVTYLQTAQGLLTQFGIDFWRSRWPKCTMAMSWVFNVIFPDTMSWSYVDYFGVPKRSYYYQKRAFSRLHVCASFPELFNPPGEPVRFRLTAINEDPQSLPGLTLAARLYDSRLQLLASHRRPVALAGERTQNCGGFSYDIPRDAQPQVLFLCVELWDGAGNLLSRSHYCPRIGQPQERMPYLAEGPWIAEVAQTRTQLEGEVTRSEDCLTVTLANTGPVPAFQVYLHAPQQDHLLRYSDNCLWLEPGERCTLTIRSFEELPQTLELSAWNADTLTLSEKGGQAQ